MSAPRRAGLAAALRYHAEHGHLRVAADHEDAYGYRLRAFITGQRTAHRQGGDCPINGSVTAAAVRERGRCVRWPPAVRGGVQPSPSPGATGCVSSSGAASRSAISARDPPT
ncbi:helicase associated domain-containing protein [Streptomyces sp. NPDC002935]|uniref:helicase associated domain-containing protein n=1 Tax=unclassified Streptomyces TaxID=2593676 RepID=UPI00332CB171